MVWGAGEGEGFPLKKELKGILGLVCAVAAGVEADVLAEAFTAGKRQLVVHVTQHF